MKSSSLYTTLGLVAGIVVIINLFSNQFYLRLDFTEDRQYTLSNATRNILKDLQEPVTVRAFFSEDLPPDVAKVKRDFQEILIEYYKEPEKWPAYPAELEKPKEKFSKLTPEEWRQNMYYGWLWSLQALAKSRIEGKVVPYFATTPAWEKKNLNTALGSWAELRHDTILYGKQSGAECGGEEEYVHPPDPKGYVEPNVEFYTTKRVGGDVVDFDAIKILKLAA